MGIKFMIKKSALMDINKSMGKDKLDALKKEVIAILEKQETKEYKKAIEYIESLEDKYSHLEKSVSGEWIEKAGYGVGTVRIWKGKKYKKVSASPTRWVRVFDKEDRGAKGSMTKLINKVKACATAEELYQFCMSNHSLFQDENGVDLPIMDKLRAAVDSQKNKIDGVKTNYESANEQFKYKKEDKKLTAKLLQNAIDEGEKQLRSETDKTEIENLKQDIQANRDSLAKVKDELLDGTDEVNKPTEKKESESKTKESKDNKIKSIQDEIEKNEVERYKIEQKGQKLAKEMNDGKYEGDELHKKESELIEISKERSKVLDNLKKLNSELAEAKQKAFEDEEREKRSEDNHYWIQDSKGNRLTNESAKKRIKASYDEIDKIKNKMDSMDKADKVHAELDIRKLQHDINNLMDKLNGDDRKEMESESEKHQNRSDAMKGNKNAYKGGFEDTPISKAVEKYASDKQIKSTVNKVSSDDFASTDPKRLFMMGTFHEDGYKIATDGHIISMIKSDYLADDEGKIKATPKAIKEIDKGIKKLNETLTERENILNQEAKAGKGTNRYKLAQERVDEVKKEIANAEKSKETGVINGNFPAYKKVIPSVAGNDIEPASGFEDFNKILKVAKVAAAYNKAKEEKASVKVGDYNFDPNQLINAVAMAEKHGLKNVNFRPNSYNPANSPIEFSGDNGYVVIMPMGNDSGRTTFDAATGDVSGKSNDDIKDFLSGDKKSDVKKELKDMSDDELNSLEKDYKDKVEKQKKENVKLYDEFNYSGQGVDHPSWKKWIDGSQKIKELDAEYWKVYDEIKKRENKANPSGMADPKKVNGYGEATDREITSATYKRDVARKEKDLNNFFGRGMNKKGVKKALFDLISMLDDSEDEELEPDFEDESYSDYDASQPELFNSTSYKVGAALDSIFGC